MKTKKDQKIHLDQEQMTYSYLSTQSTSVLFGNAMRKNVRKMMETLSQLLLLNLLFENIFLTQVAIQIICDTQGKWFNMCHVAFFDLFKD